METKQQSLDHYYYEDLGMCGCGRPEDIKDFLIKLMDARENKRISDSKKSFDELMKGPFENSEVNKVLLEFGLDTDLVMEFVLHTLEKAGFLEHGSSIYGSWMTDKGKHFFELLKKDRNGDIDE